MTLSLEKFTKKQKILGVIVIILCLIFIGFIAFTAFSTKVKAPTTDQPISSPIPVVTEEVNDISSDTGVLVDQSKYPNPGFPPLLLSDVIGETKIPNPTVQYNGQPRVYLDCGTLNAKEYIFRDIKKACVARLIADGSVALFGAPDSTYLYFKGKTRDEKTETLIHDISTTGNKTYLIYEYDYNTQSANYIDRISLVVPQTLQENDLIAFFNCVGKPIQPYSDNSCYAVYGKEWYDSNAWYLDHKDNYFRQVNLPL